MYVANKVMAIVESLCATRCFRYKQGLVLACSCQHVLLLLLCFLSMQLGIPSFLSSPYAWMKNLFKRWNAGKGLGTKLAWYILSAYV